ncbi:hypothetical protein ABPG72_011483 [Tetrahymena utriculariae]
MIQKYYRESIQKSLKIQKNRKNKRKQILIKPYTHRLLDQNTVFYLYAGIVLPCDFDYEAKNDYNGIQDIKRGFRNLLYIEKRKNYSIINVSYNFKGLEKFDFLIDIYMRKGNKDYYDLAQMLQVIQSNIQIWKKQSQLISQIRINKYEEYYSEYQKFIQQCLDKLDQLDQSKLYQFGFLFYNYETLCLEQNKVGFSKGLLSLLGIDQDQFANIIYRTGYLTNFMVESFLSTYTIQLMSLAYKNIVFQKSVTDKVIISFDGFSIPCKEIRSLYFPQSNHPIDYFEIGFGITEYDISIAALQQLLNMREMRYYEDKNIIETFFDQSFEYSINSQLFIEKYYPKAITNDYLRCKYKYLENQKTNNIQLLNQNSNINQKTSYNWMNSNNKINQKNFSQMSQMNDINSQLNTYKSDSFFQDQELILEFQHDPQKNQKQIPIKVRKNQEEGLGLSQTIKVSNNNIIQDSQSSVSQIQQEYNQINQVQDALYLEPFSYIEKEFQSQRKSYQLINKISINDSLNLIFELNNLNDQKNSNYLLFKNNQQYVFDNCDTIISELNEKNKN